MATKKCLLALILFAFVLSMVNTLAADDSGLVNDDGDDDDDGNSGDDDGGDLPGAKPGDFNRTIFPPNFIFGAGSSAYQIEGAADLRGKNIWDTFVETHKGWIPDGANASIADDQYHRYKDDMKILSDLGFDSYRFSISWARILPHGKLSGGINQTGVDYYNNLTDEIIARGMKPFATLFHWDLPQTLEDEYLGFLNKTNIVADFRDYADLCFKLFGKKIKNWVTMNEPYAYSVLGYAYGAFPPNRCSNTGIKRNSEYGFERFSKYAPIHCDAGNSGTEPYIVTHNILLAHATAVKVYRDKYQPSQGGQIGITLNSKWFVPYGDSSRADRDAGLRALAFSLGWFMNPMLVGAYPTEMVTYVGQDRLPTFKQNESELVKGSYDFIGLNYYTSIYAKDIPCENTTKKSYLSDSCVLQTAVRNKTNNVSKESSTIGNYPMGLRRLLIHTRDHYNNPPIYITENGVGRENKGYPRLHDKKRTRYHHNHLTKVHGAMRDYQVNVHGYFMWAFLDDFEWIEGYSTRFGLVFIDYEDQSLNRTCKDSAMWFHKFLNTKNIPKC